MKNKAQRLWALLTLCLALVLAFSPLPGRADFGDFSSDSDWGSDSSWDSGSSWDSDWSSSGSSRNRSSRPASPLDLIVFILYIAFLVYIAKRNQEKRAYARSSSQGANTENHWNFELRSMNTLAQECSAEAITDLYRRMQSAWGAGDITSLEADFTPDAYAQYKRQLDEKNARNEHAHCIVHSVSAYKMGWNENLTEWRVGVLIYATITAWDTDGEGRIISGSDTKRKRMTYAWEMRKSKNAGSGMKTCPNCGAALEINAGARCPHCETQLTASANRWALHAIKGVSQRTLD